ncbi:MAG TPA: response regulator [Verrucomicrobiae bacterium]|nr:response regulator [Verrucomicrobiae bacterium]
MQKTRTILYVEDDPVTLTAYQNRLKLAGYHVIPARDGLEAIKQLSTMVPDLVVLDLMLPRFSGEEVLQYIRTHDALAAVPVIVLSTNSILDSEQEHLLESASQRILKSLCTPATLLETIQKALPDEAA